MRACHRYAAKYASKSTRQTELLDDVLRALGERVNDPLRPNIQQTLTHLVLANCSHRAYITKQEVAYRVMDLPYVFKTFETVKVVGCYRRAMVSEMRDAETIRYSDRTEYSAYAERMNPTVTCAKNLTREELEVMNFKDFAETINATWKPDKDATTGEPIQGNSRVRMVSRIADKGHWYLSRVSKRRHVRWNTIVYSAPAHLYEPVEEGLSTTQTLYFDLPEVKQKQLYRAYQELIVYVAWSDSPEQTFLSAEVRELLKDSAFDPEPDVRYSLRRLVCFHRVYMDMWQAGEVAKPGTHWHRDNQHAYTMFLTTSQNRDIKLERAEGRGHFDAKYEAAPELVDSAVQLRVPGDDEPADGEMPSALNFLPLDIFRDILKQVPPTLEIIRVAFPLQNDFQHIEEMVTKHRLVLFMAAPPAPRVDIDAMSDVHRAAIDLFASGVEPILYIYGR